ncbi:MAG: DUF3035 domain-containing protein [Alphaproteobacteria bacterium]|nr:DUF3035 domain-containing protein [Alphaproteobacteria bacterium]
MRLILPCLAAATLVLAGCSGAKETLGLTKQAPDEFAVVKRAPLSMPPDYALRPPRPGAPRPQELEPSAEAREAIFGESAGTAVTPASQSEGESILLQDAGVTAAETDSTIRETVDSEIKQEVDTNQPVVDKLLSYAGAGNGSTASVVDAQAEAERLKKNKEEGKPVTEGKTPTLNN